MTPNHPFVPRPEDAACHYSANGLGLCGAKREDHPVTLPSGPPVRTDYERALERIRELEEGMGVGASMGVSTLQKLRAENTSLRGQVHALTDSERRLRAENARLNELVDQARANVAAAVTGAEQAIEENEALTSRLSNLSILAREVASRVDAMMSKLDK